MQKHTESKTFFCEVCGSVFSKGWDLKIRMRTHTGEKPFACEVCSSAFLNCFTLKTHL